MTDERRSVPESDDFHFVSIVPHHETKTLMLLDGLQEKPIKLGSFEKNEGWFGAALTAINKIIEG